MSGLLGDRRVRSFPGDDVPTCPTFSDDETDAMYGMPAAESCTCYDPVSMEFDPAGPCGRRGCRALESEAS